MTVGLTNSSSSLYNQPSTSNQQETEQDTSSLESHTSTELSETETSPPTVAKGRPKTKTYVDTWKNKATTLWKPTKKVIVDPDPEAISNRTQ